MNELINIAAQINNKQDSIENNLKSALRNAIECGGLLVQAKRNCEHGKFMLWIENNCKFKKTIAFQYIKCFQHSAKVRGLGNLQIAYKKIAEIECQGKKQIEQQRQQKYKQYKKTGQKPENWSRADDYSYKKHFDEDSYEKRKEEAIEKKGKEGGGLKDAIGYCDEIMSQNKEQQKFLTKITDGNQYQGIFFKVIDNYVNELPDDIEKMEALQNIIKYCKRVMIKYQQLHVIEK